MQTVKSRNGEDIPVFKNQHPMHSKYNPSAEAEIFSQSLKSGFIIIGGIGGGFHIETAVKKFPEAFFVCVEADIESLEYSVKLNGNSELQKKENVIFTTVQNLENIILSNYLPQIYENLSLGFNRTWETENKETAFVINETVKTALKKIKADYSVQSHFARQWQKNIMQNAEREFSALNLDSELTKTCAVIAAGPSLEKDLARLKEKKASFFILSTDTAYGTLLKNNIFPDAVISTDCQHVSCTHFYSMHSTEEKKTLFIFDLSSPPCAVRQVLKKRHPIFFFQSGHPLSRMLFSEKEMLSLSSGSGTVTVAAADFAFKAGFSSIEFFGADFSYSFEKPYARGTYLEPAFFKESYRLENVETKYSALMYRTELYNQKENEFSRYTKGFPTSEILDSYRKSLLDFLEKNGFQKQNGIFCLKNNPLRINASGKNADEIKKIKTQLRENPEQFQEAYLPLTAFLKRLYPEKKFKELCAIAYKYREGV
ncbi:MAG: motility associated factor glycosyltransferase family protein [Treponema sp.]|nr:motility associated factor glycosyltransferase family protein [Treponema sp.]